MTATVESRKTAACRWGLAAALIFFALGLPRLLLHEPWRDELGVWLIARASRSIPELFSHLRFDGHPYLWPLLNYVVAPLGDGCRPMQLLHLAIATAALAVFFLKAPFSAPVKILFAFGYFPFYEYAIISRAYGIGMLGLFLACAAYSRAAFGPHHAWALILMAHSSIYGIIIGVAFLLADLAASRGTCFLSRRGFLSLLASIAGMLLALSQIIPPPGGVSAAAGWRTSFSLHELFRSLGVVWRAFVPLPLDLNHVWQSAPFDGRPLLQGSLGLVLCVLWALVFRKDRRSLVLWLAGSIGIVLFVYLKYYGGMRHHGHVFLVCVAAAWLTAARHGGAAPQARLARPLGGALLVQVAAGLLLSAIGLVRPFTAAPAAANYILERKLLNRPIVGDRAHPVSSVAARLGTPVYYPSERRKGTFIEWDDKRREVSPEEAIIEAKHVAAQHRSDVLVILNYPLREQDPSLSFLAAFEESICPSERYYLYTLRSRPANIPGGPAALPGPDDAKTD